MAVNEVSHQTGAQFYSWGYSDSINPALYVWLLPKWQVKGLEGQVKGAFIGDAHCRLLIQAQG